jgi:hypothetical protein
VRNEGDEQSDLDGSNRGTGPADTPPDETSDESASAREVARDADTADPEVQHE